MQQKVRCRQLDGRAAILVVVARPGGFHLARSVCATIARRLFTAASAVPPLEQFATPRHAADASATYTRHELTFVASNDEGLS